MTRFASIAVAFYTAAVFVHTFCHDCVAVAATTQPWTAKKLMEMISDIKGTDLRLVRWDAGERTLEKQSDGACDDLSDVAAKVIVGGSNSHGNDDDQEQLLQLLACEYATFCITDNPQMRAEFSDVSGIHQAVVDLVRSPDPKTSSKACHVIYIASFSNQKNQHGFFDAGAVQALAHIIMDDSGSIIPVQAMWAMAALQNLAASYCETENDGRCYWAYPNGENNLVIGQDSLPIVSDGAPIRKAAIQINGLVDALIEWACDGPVEGGVEDGFILPGENAQAGRDEMNVAIAPWAAAGALKNLAIEKDGRELIDTSDAVGCFCDLKESDDWLEEGKGDGVLLHMRSHNPCWIDGEGEVTCVDEFFWDEEGYSCQDYGPHVTDEECEATDTSTDLPAADACCSCGGGTRFYYEGEGEDYDYEML